MKGIVRKLIIIFILTCRRAALFYVMVKNKIIVMNELFVNKNRDVIGVDVSEYQMDIEMVKLKEQGIQFVIIRATEGSHYVDDMFLRNWKNAHEADLPAGAYHFFSFDTPGATQAANFISAVGDLDNDLIPAVDLEFYGNKRLNPPEKEDVIRELQLYLDILERRYGVKAMIYASQEIWDKYLEGGFDDYPLWVRNVYYPISVSHGDDWAIWQYRDTGMLEGYSGGEKYIDMNVLNNSVSLSDLMIP